MVTIPFAEFPAFTEEIILDNIPYRFTFTWNGRGEFWVFSIADRDEVKLISGIKVLIDFELLRKYPGRGTPPGELYAIDPSGQLETIGRNDFQDQASLVYVEEDEVATI
ncbi:hypothetical protein KAR91_48735 [Candidatus Pacearchaeota archaeon]|nr:hypothetical protein [Candidatus Pacearchaeota archaeon]